MKAIINGCTLCGSFDAEILFPAFFEKQVSSFENVMICKQCGLVYKNPIIPCDERTHYVAKTQWSSSWANPYYEKKFKTSANFIQSIVKLTKDSAVLDIGAAEGHFLRHLCSVAPVYKVYGIEPAKAICELAKKKDKRLNMIPYTLEDTEIPNSYFDLITAFGVDYLFFDHNKMLAKISKALSNNGYFYVERNVFLEMPAFVTKKVECLEDLFGTNAMMKNWFTEKQYEKQLSKYFSIEKKKIFIFERVKGIKNRHVGYLCKTKAAVSDVVFDNDYDQNKKFVLSMRRKTNVIG